MKYASLILIYLAMLGSWKAVNHGSAVSEIVHVGIQEDLKRVIEDYINANLPDSKDLTFHRLWTELKAPGQVKASFLYSFADEGEESGAAARVEIEGYAILNHDKKNTDSAEVWSFDELYILNNHVVFEEGITIKPTESDEL